MPTTTNSLGLIRKPTCHDPHRRFEPQAAANRGPVQVTDSVDKRAEYEVSSVAGPQYQYD